MEIARKFYIMTASSGTGHSQAARAIAEAIQRTHPADSVQVLDFVSSNLFSIDHIIKDGYLKMIDVFPEMYDHLYSDSQSSRFGQLVIFPVRRSIRMLPSSTSSRRRAVS